MVIEQINYATKIVNAYTVYELDTQPKILLNNFKLKSWLLGVTNIVKNSDKAKWVYSGQRIAFDGTRSWSLGNNFAENYL